MLKLYHNEISTCSQKVRLVLAHKSFEFESEEIDLLGGGQHDSEYVKLNLNHVVPTLIHSSFKFQSKRISYKHRTSQAAPDPRHRNLQATASPTSLAQVGAVVCCPITLYPQQPQDRTIVPIGSPVGSSPPEFC
jgi:hypothetical protein